jgi:hypothetical protein
VSTTFFSKLHSGPAANSLLGSATGDLVLRVANGAQVGRIVRLSAAKCSIGSSAECTLRLRGRGIAPLHCLLLRGARQTIARRWSAETRLNDRPFDDAVLRAGDRLSIGPVELQVVQVPNLPQSSEAPAANVPVVEGPISKPAPTSPVSNGANEARLAARLALANRQGRNRLRGVLAKLRKYQLRLTELETRRSQLTEEQTRLAAERARLQSLESDLQLRLADVEERRRAAADDEKSLAARGTKLRELQDQDQRRLQTLRESLDARSDELERQSRRIVEEAAAVAEAAARWERESAELRRREADLQERAEQADRRRIELEDAARLLAEREATLVARAQALQSQAEQLEVEAARRLAEAVQLANASPPVPAVSAEEMERLAARTAELDLREQKLIERTATLERRESCLAADEASSAARRTQLAAVETQCRLREESLAERTAKLAESETQLALRSMELGEREVAVTTRCESLKNHWTDLSVREQRLEQAQSDLAEQAARLAATPLAVCETPVVQAPAESLLEDRLQIERLEAEVKAWRDEAKLWKSQFDAAQFAPRTPVAETVASDELPSSTAPETAVADTAVAESPIVATHADELQAEAEFGPSHGDVDPATTVEADPLPEHEPQLPETDETTETIGLPEPVSTATVDAEDTAMADAAESVTEPEAIVSDTIVAEPDLAAEEPDVAVDESEVSAEVSDEEPSAETAAVDAQPVPKSESAADVLRRLGLAAALEEDSRPTPPPAPMPQPAVAIPEPTVKHEGDEALNDYMQQLFKRLGVKQGEQPAVPETKPVPTAATPAQPAVTAQPETPREPAPALPPLSMAEFKARSVAAERKSDLSALRELANLQSKAAITKHDVKRESHASKWKMIVGGLSFATGAVCLWSYWTGHNISQFGAIAGFTGSLLFLVQSAGLKKQAKQSARSLDDVLQKSAGRAKTEAPVEAPAEKA